jgi:hypothetical protein
MHIDEPQVTGLAAATAGEGKIVPTQNARTSTDARVNSAPCEGVNRRWCSRQDKAEVLQPRDEIAEIGAAIPRDLVTGSCYPEEAMSLLDG